MRVLSVPQSMVLSYIDYGSLALHTAFIAAGFNDMDYIWPSVRYGTSLVNADASGSYSA